MKKILLSLAVLVITVGCSIANTEVILIETPDKTSEIYITPFKQASLSTLTKKSQTSKPSGTKVPYTSIETTVTPTIYQTLQSIKPSIIQMCTNGSNELPVDQIGLGNNLRLLVYPTNQYASGAITGGLWYISETITNPQIITNTNPISPWIYQSFIPSPEGHWIKMQRYNEDYSQSAAWILSPDGLQKWLLDEGDFSVVIPSWVSDKEMIGIGVPNPEQYEDLNWEDYIPLFSINPFTLETRNLEPLPEKAIYDRYFTQGSESYTIFHEGHQPYDDWSVYNYNDHTKLPVLNWLVGREDVNFANSGITLQHDSNENVLFYIYVQRPYGLDIAWNLNLDQISLPQKYEEAMTAISIPGEFSEVTIGPWVNENSVVIETMLGDITDRKLDRFFLFNFENKTMREYCLDDERQPEIQVSPDGHLLSLTYSSTESIGWTPEEVVILNLETGDITRIPDVGAVGWGVVDESITP
jgi:hypothetical protein